MPDGELTLSHAYRRFAGPQTAACDEALVAGLRDGDAAAARVLIDKYSQYVQRMLQRVLGYDHELPDLVQEVFVQALSSIDSLCTTSAFKPWLARIAVFVARGRIRQRSRRRWLVFFESERVPDVAAEVASEGVVEALRAAYRALDRLPTDERIPVSLRLIEGMSVDEIADACAVSLATAKRRLARGHARFLVLCGRDAVLRDWVSGSGECVD